MTTANSQGSERSEGAAPGPAPYTSLAALRDAHLALRGSGDAAAASPTTPADRIGAIRRFLTDARRAGAFLSDDGERRAAQGILDYWSGELVTLPGAKPADYKSSLLDPPDPKQAPREQEQEQQSPTNTSDERALIRWTAFARQWNDSKRNPGYLLTGDAIHQAARFRAVDHGIDDLVTASEAAQHARRKWIRAIAATMVITVVGCAALVAFWQFWVLDNLRRSYLSELKANGSKQTHALHRWDQLQAWLPPLDASGTRSVRNIALPGIRLNSPNFAEVAFTNVSFAHGHLAEASFTQAVFSVAGATRQNDLRGADLRRTQFRGARIHSTSLFGANLYRSVFDRATLCDVDFSEASLRSASFWAVSLDDKTRESLGNTAWWQAVGWRWSMIQELANASGGDADRMAERLKHLKASQGFREEIDRDREKFRTASSGTPTALALNDIAWTLAIWGIDISNPRPAPSRLQGADPCSLQGVPGTAREAAERALCILNAADAEQKKDDLYADLVAGIKDTLAYVLMQSGPDHMAEAVKLFQELEKESPTFFNDSVETRFRYAIAQYAAGLDKAAAVKAFNAALRTYQPTHELQTLRDYIFKVPEFVDTLQKSVDGRWPSISPQEGCQAGAGGAGSAAE